MTRTLTELEQALCKHAGIAAAKARRLQSLCRQILIFAGNSPYDEAPVSRRFQYRFAYPTDDTRQLTQIASQAAKSLFILGVRYYKVGVGLIDLEDARHAQQDLFNTSPSNPTLMKAFDGINGKYGSDTVFMAAQGITPKWAMRREFLSPQYTTKWQDFFMQNLLSFRLRENSTFCCCYFSGGLPAQVFSFKYCWLSKG
ncbi:DUF4113 domain-containing protein [Photobacterium atrarenae]|uniref:DUF4113 domain-containing protein n=1 Tax=Photobacterium atrarenae TaxID=865757 RepID=A0ABY5GIN6_9GAMM|nr:DUF4113 domain-containing protein [Photobacterium atrarenae]UTV29011.1 DUF4113 domain-containing protein [Photobacterium atrarenae]